MTFYALALLISLAVWFLVISTTSLLGWPLRRILFGKSAVTGRRMERSPAALADTLFVLRTAPLFLALILAAGIALPAFLENEPHSTGEPISMKLWLLAFAGAIVLAVVTSRGLSMLWATVRVESRWRAHSPNELKIPGVGARVYCVESESPLLAVTGVFRPRIFVAREVVRVLSPGELRAAVAHEMDHVRRLDNLKQFLLNLTRAPRWLGGSQDFSWTLASEVAADAGALARGASALDLASALVKVAALKRGPALGARIAASHLLPDLPGSPLAARVQRLQQVLEDDGSPCEPARPSWKMVLLVALPVLLYLAAVSAVLPAVHEGLEFLVR
jgi:Zn-dependent protease with chaperone function